MLDATNTIRAGQSVAAAGDIDGDGFDDVIVGAPEAGSGSGAAYVVYGHAHGNVDLSSPGANVTVLTASGETGFGSQVAKVGDFNGDDFDDLLITNDAETAYVVLGRLGGFGSSLDVATDPQVYKIEINFSDGFRQLSVPGDVDGDGLDDVLLTRDQAGELRSYLVLGTAGTGGSITPATYTFPDYTKAAGDINNDGLADLLFFSLEGFEGTTEDDLYVIYGNADPAEIDHPSAAYTFNFADVTDFQAAGDFNSDGLDDIVGAFKPDFTSPPADFVATIVFSGNPSDPLADITGIRAETNSTLTNYRAGAIGDVNDDGFGDIALTHAGSGDIYVVLGSANPASVIALDAVAAGNGGVKIYVDPTVGFLPIAPAGDVNGDGVADILVGNPLSQHAAQVIFGQSDWHL